MKISYFLTFLSIIYVNVLNAIEIGEQETNLCICSDFTYLNNQGLLVNYTFFLTYAFPTFYFKSWSFKIWKLSNFFFQVGNCLATLETQFGRRFSGQFCYVHQPHNCPGQTIPSSDLPGMEISFTACRHKKRHDARRYRAALRLLNLLGLFPNDIERPLTGFAARPNSKLISDIDE